MQHFVAWLLLTWNKTSFNLQPQTLWTRQSFSSPVLCLFFQDTPAETTCPSPVLCDCFSSQPDLTFETTHPFGVLSDSVVCHHLHGTGAAASLNEASEMNLRVFAAGGTRARDGLSEEVEPVPVCSAEWWMSYILEMKKQ